MVVRALALLLFRLAAKIKRRDKVLLITAADAGELCPVVFFCPCNFPCMERLLAILFSVMLLIATAPPKVSVSMCSYAGGMCVQKESATSASGGSCALDHEDSASGKRPACPMPLCCVSGPCCCLCLLPERPVLPEPYWLQETHTQPATYRAFLPQQVWLSVWKPPAFSV